MLFLIVLCFLLLKLMHYLANKSSGAFMLRARCDMSINAAAMNAMLGTCDVEESMISSDAAGELRKVVWKERDRAFWGGDPPKVRSGRRAWRRATRVLLWHQF